MSRKHRKCEQPSDDKCGRGCERGSRKPSLPILIILILILLQFSGGNNIGPLGGGFAGVDNGILFIIALFYLSCCNTCNSIF